MVCEYSLNFFVFCVQTDKFYLMIFNIPCIARDNVKQKSRCKGKAHYKKADPIFTSDPSVYFLIYLRSKQISIKAQTRSIFFIPRQKLKQKPKGKVNSMADMSHFTKEMNDYFQSLPKFLQESIVQSGTKVETLRELKGFSKEICEKGFRKKS